MASVADWLHRRVAGLAPAAPGYREIEVRPSAHGFGPGAAAFKERVARVLRSPAGHQAGWGA